MKPAARPVPCPHLLLLPLVLVACAKQAAPAAPGTYSGVLTGSAKMGTLDIVVDATPSPHGVSGALLIGNSAVPLSGTLNPGSLDFHLAGGGYELEGIAHSADILGTYTGPEDQGTFGLLPTPPGIAVSRFCGTAVWTSGTDLPSSPAGIVATAGGGMVICVGLGYPMLGTEQPDGELSCSGTGSLSTGTIDGTGGTGQWGNGMQWGNWKVSPCPAPGTDGGAADDGGSADGGALD